MNCWDRRLSERSGEGPEWRIGDPLPPPSAAWWIERAVRAALPALVVLALPVAALWLAGVAR
ncbi:MAG: hypothetical protein AB7P02_25185 [Alphaproteobacteria bacterium]